MQVFIPGATLYIKLLIGILAISDFAYSFEIDFSRRQKDMSNLPVDVHMGRTPASEKANVKKVIAYSMPTSDVVILNTDQGFVPKSVNVQAGRRYIFRVVNINKEKKNVSFVMAAQGQHHATYYGEMKTFPVEVHREGIYSFECPETAAEGRLVVLPVAQRDIASEIESAGEVPQEAP